MNIINVPNGQGKTEYIIRKSANENLPIIVSNIHRKNGIKARALEIGVRVDVYTVHEFMHAHGIFTRDTKILIDDLDLVLAEFVGFEVDTATCSIKYSDIDVLKQGDIN